ncbi:MAG: ATP-binding protein [Gammaproteobacteria bacterium]
MNVEQRFVGQENEGDVERFLRSQIDAINARLQRQNKGLLDIANARLDGASNLQEAFRRITRITAEILQVERVGIWEHDRERSRLHCKDLYFKSRDEHIAGTVLHASDFPAYFRALETDHIISADDARNDPRTRDFGDYLSEFNIYSMLDSDVHLSGRLVGVICSEHCGGPRHWTLDEQIFLGNVSDQISLLLEAWQQHRDDAALRLSEERYRSLVTATSQIVWTTNANGEVVEDLPSWRAYTGQDYSQMLGLGWRMAIHPEDIGKVGVGGVWHFENQARKSFETEYRIRRNDGLYRIFNVRGAPVRDASGAVREWVGTCDDVTDEREAARALQIAHDELEHKVAERTRRLRVANAKLRELDRLKSEFLATMSHELRTPLNSIIGFTHIIREGLAGPINDEQKKQLGMVSNSASHLLSLINDLLDLSRIESGRMEIANGEVDCAAVIAEVKQTLEPLIATKGLTMETLVEPGVSMVSTDRKKLFQILLNLANNAVKFTERGKVSIHVIENQSTLIFDVTDSGIGIKPENMPLLFEAFRQIEGSARRRYEGTGLGLHLSLRLAHLLGGDIRVRSEYGSGSTFTLILPKLRGETAHA